MDSVVGILWVIVISAMTVLLFGCEGVKERDTRAGAFRVEADCDKDTVSVDFELEQQADDNKVRVTK